MDINTALTSINTISQKGVAFLFNSKWSKWILIFFIIFYFVWKGFERRDQKKSVEEAYVTEEEGSASNE